MSKKISEEDKALFREAMRSVKPLVQSDKIARPTNKFVQGKKEAAPNSAKPIAVPLSDYYYPGVKAEAMIYYAQRGLPAKRMKELQQGQIPIEARLDLHGKNPDTARHGLLQFIQSSRQKGKRCLLVIHGKGGQQGEIPIMKNLVNTWLMQIPEILAFHSALNKHGGSGAVYVLLKNK